MYRIFDERRYLIPFRATLLPQIFTDVLVIGEGVAGLRAAIGASAHSDVILINKGKSSQSNSYWAQGGLAAVLSPEDSFDQHIQDTLGAGAGLCDQPVVQRVIEDGPARVQELLEWGMPFDQREDGGGISFGREGGHNRPRIVHADGDATGRVLVDTLVAKLRSLERVRVFEHCFVLDLLTTDGSAPRCVGVVTHHAKYGLQVIWAKATILATGGCGQVYRESTNPPVATGDGLAMAYRAGVKLADLEFMQFHPTTLYIAGAARSLITEAVRGEGAQLIDRNGHRFMPDYHEMGELAPRDIVTRAIIQQMGKTNATAAYLDCRPIGGDRFRQRFPGISRLLDKFGIDPDKDSIPIHPSAHYMIGGAWVDEAGRTNLPGLYACGEAACTGLHGANRLASNSLLEGLVCGAVCGQVCEEAVSEGFAGPVKLISDIPLSDRSELDLEDVRSSLRSVMWRHVGIEREGERLDEVAEMFHFWARYTLDKIFDERPGWETQNMLLVGALMTRAAAWRQESRGTHFRRDQPEPRDELRLHELWQRGGDGPEQRPVRDG